MRLLFRLLAFLPLPVLHGLGNLVGWLLWLIPNKRRNVALQNIRACLPELDARAQNRIARRGLCHEAKTALEFPVLWFGRRARVLRLIRRIHNGQLVAEALARGKGVIFLTPHLGSWEAPGLEYSTRLPIIGLYKPQKGALEQLTIEGRSRFGAGLIPTIGGSTRQAALPILQNNQTLYFMPDQDPPPGRGIFAPFFGIPAHSQTLVSRLAQQTGAAVLFVYGERLSWGRGYVAHYHLAPDSIYSSDLAESVATVNRCVEDCVRECPEQYWWGYARFRRRPEGMAAFYQ